nr:hypothetical protein [uncultured Friedmanniella sp.]
MAWRREGLAFRPGLRQSSVAKTPGVSTVLFRSLLRRLLLPDLDAQITALQQSIGQQLDHSRTLEREIETLRSGQGQWLREALDGIVADSLARPVEADGDRPAADWGTTPPGHLSAEVPCPAGFPG